nr:fimbrial protein [uncultured Moellerella sp.]
MKLSKLFISSLLLGFSSLAQATCENSLSIAPDIIIDLSDKLYLSDSVTETYRTLYSGNFKCTNAGWLKKNNISNISGFEKQDLYLKLNNKNILRVKVLNISKRDIELKREEKRYSADEINTSFTLEITAYEGRVNSSNVFDARGSNQFRAENLLIATDSSDVSNFWRFIQDLITFLFSWKWPEHKEDIYFQPVIIKFNHKETTCQFTNSGTTVTLPDINRTALLSSGQSGYTNFNLDFSCSFLLNNKTSNPIKAYLSSSHLTTDKKIMIDPSSNGAKGVGIALNYQQKSVIFSANQGQRENATLLINKKEGERLEKSFSLNMDAYYQVYDKKNLTAGKLNTTAILNLEYF